ncbi:crossover junction endodeoxyribonuclease RuvC [Bdellovibrio sp. SKB1291214]|uniref:crossover junction endodeoxyribonuclease RuvC n=1 Tax=Bdellovibrio sp. SKB1291214 TaxID=1732569 RepID=UPI000B515391|nr:crossover junction endodeoxyribonuclease RuvC [Bdellovibrio sp. SKB1291214]UYL07603.1 crossover junction endodeoxyribonuclease RuvC [Bdellovibrio sp. SKB1291214]
MSLTILGVDPGSRITGFGVVRISNGKIEHINHGVILLDAVQEFPVRMAELGSAFREVMEKYRPHQVVIEKIFLGKNADSAFKLGHARGVIMYEAGIGKATVSEYATRSVKKGITGTGAATKEDVQAVLKAMLNLKAISRIDASDALAMACYHAFEMKKNAVIQKAVSL